MNTLDIDISVVLGVANFKKKEMYICSFEANGGRVLELLPFYIFSFMFST